MEDVYDRVYLLDTENLGAGYLKNLCKLTARDLVVAVYTKHSVKFTYGQLQPFLDCKAKFQIEDARVGTANALDFQITTLLGYMLHKAEVEGQDTEFIILSHDFGYCGVVQYWQSRGKKVNLKGDIDGESINVEDVLNQLSLSQKEKDLRCQREKYAQSFKINSGAVSRLAVPKTVISATTSAIDKFNKRLEKTEALQSDMKKGDSLKESSKKPEFEKPASFTMSLTDLIEEKETKALTEEVTETVVEEAKAAKEDFKINEDLIVLSTGNRTTMYKNVYNRCKQKGREYEDVLSNSEQVSKIMKLSTTDAIIVGYIIYVARNLKEIEEYSARIINTDSRAIVIKSLLKRVEHKEFINKNGL